LKSLTEQLNSVGESASEDDRVATLLCSLPESYNNLIVVLESKAEKPTMEFVIARLLHEESKRMESPNAFTENLERAMASVKVKSKSRDQRITSPPAKVKGKCYNCGMTGHFARDCRKPKKAKSAQSKHEQANASCTTPHEGSQHILFLTSSGIPGERKFVSTWYIDSGVSEHMSNDKDRMESYEKFLTQVKAFGKVSNLLKVNALGKWNNESLTDVLYVPSLAMNYFG